MTMRFAFVADFNPHTTAEQRDAALGRRAEWSYPDGVEVISEHWSYGSSPLIYTVFETDDPKALWQLTADWNDVFDVRVVPVMTAEFGLAHGQEVFEKRPR
jgi:hypothetical protein